ncbi:MAG TPA: hypothetical protein VMR62_32020 [Bryobacteraceae bacterium]|nr:hypothetical protein [Bryobacteraceae bacterium]
MNLQKTLALSLALGTLLSLTGATASAETITRATFTLPEQAYWNDVLLPAGDYTVSVDATISGVPTVSLRGEGVAATFIVPAGGEQFSGQSDLRLDGVNGTYVVRQFDSGAIGRSFRFPVSKAVPNQMLRGATQPVTVPVSAAAGS